MAKNYLRLQSRFEDLNLVPSITQHCHQLGFKHPTPVQYYCIPQILNGKDCISVSHTGTGKTLAFALPIMQKWIEEPFGIFALILTPTRELAFQIADQFHLCGKFSGSLKISVVVGGMNIIVQRQELSTKPHIVISTPGRLADCLQSCEELSFKRIKFLVLDEADRLLEGSFNEQLQVIFAALPMKRQTLLFSATMTKTLEEVKNISTTDPFVWSADSDIATVEKLDQRYILTPPPIRDAYLVHVIQEFQEKHPNGSIMVFTQTCKSCELLSLALNSLGFENMSINAMLSQRQRLASLSKFKSGFCKLLIATDVASRGLDIPTVQLVINHNVNSVPKDYIHRVGRTARAGREGLAITLITQYDVKRIHAIEDLINTKLKLFDVNEKKVLNIMMQVNVAVREAEIRLDEMDFGEKKSIYKRKKMILQGKDPDAEAEKETKRKKKKHSKRNRTKRT